ncbi:MAG TPA: hypothetical protein VIX19_04635 [Terriglobales bacterium]
MKRVLALLLMLGLVGFLAPVTHVHADDWVFLGKAHVDGQHDHDNIEVGDKAGRYRFLQIRVATEPIEFDHIVVHYGDGQPQALHVRNVIPAGGQSRAIKLDGDRFVKSFELWYSRVVPSSSKPELDLYGRP